MASSFSFGFSGDDIDDNVGSDDGAADLIEKNSSAAADSLTEGLTFYEAKRHTLDELVCLFIFPLLRFIFYFLVCSLL